MILDTPPYGRGQEGKPRASGDDPVNPDMLRAWLK